MLWKVSLILIVMIVNLKFICHFCLPIILYHLNYSINHLINRKALSRKKIISCLRCGRQIKMIKSSFEIPLLQEQLTHFMLHFFWKLEVFFDVSRGIETEQRQKMGYAGLVLELLIKREIKIFFLKSWLINNRARQIWYFRALIFVHVKWFCAHVHARKIIVIVGINLNRLIYNALIDTVYPTYFPISYV